MNMDQKLRDAIEQGKEQIKLGSKSSDQTLAILISTLANYVASYPVAKTLKEQLEDLKKKKAE